MSLFEFVALCGQFLLANPLLVFGSVVLSLYAIKKELENDES